MVKHHTEHRKASELIHQVDTPSLGLLFTLLTLLTIRILLFRFFWFFPLHSLFSFGPVFQDFLRGAGFRLPVRAALCVFCIFSIFHGLRLFHKTRLSFFIFPAASG